MLQKLQAFSLYDSPEQDAQLTLTLCFILSADIHVGHLHRIFPAETGMRVGEYLTNLRIDKAKSLFIRMDLSTAIIAHRITYRK